MTSTSPPAYPAEYYYPEFINSRSDDPRLSPSRPPPLSKSVTIVRPRKKSTNRTKNIAKNVVTRRGLPDVDVNESAKTDPRKSLIRDPIERIIPRLIVNKDIIQQGIHSATIPVTNLEDNKYIVPNNHTNKVLSQRTKPIESNRKQHQVVKFVEDEQPIDDYWKKEILIDDQGVVAIEPIEYDKNTFEGPFGLTRKGSFIFYIGMSLFTLIAAVFLIMTGVFYGQNYPDSSSHTTELTGIGICAFAFYLGLQLILIGLWHQKYRQEHPIRIFKKKSRVYHESTDHLKSSMKDNEQYDYSYQPPIDYPPYGYYSNPPYFSTISEEMLLRQPGGATGVGYYDGVVWPSNVEIETQPDAKFFQPMEWSLGTVQQSTVNERLSNRFDLSRSDRNFVKKTKRRPRKTIQVEPSVDDFDDLRLNSPVSEQQLPILPKAPETTELINSIAQMELSTQKYQKRSDLSPKKNTQKDSTDDKTDISFSTIFDKDQEQPHRNHHHHHRRHHHHHHSHRPHHHRHHHHHHRHHHYSPEPQSPYYSPDYHRAHSHGYHQHFHALSLPRIVTPRHPRTITPSISKIGTKVYRETGINTGNETKIMRDSSVTADLDEIPSAINNPLDKIPVLRRTIIVEPYPAEPSSQIIVKPRQDMTGKIRLGKNTQANGENETIVYPSTQFLTKKKSKKKKKSTVVNNNIIEDLHLEDVNDDNGSDFQNIKSKSNRSSSKKTIKNAFYN